MPLETFRSAGPLDNESEARTEKHRLDAVRRYDILDTPPDGAFDRITALVLITTAVHVLYKLGEMAHSRGREYLADAGAVALTGWEKRAQLITALLKIGHGQTGRSPFKCSAERGWKSSCRILDRRSRRSIAGGRS